MRALVATNRANGHAIDARTGCPEWYGERLDLAWAIGVLRPVTERIFPLGEAQAAYDLVGSDTTFGKVVLTPNR